jgi:hypothetical protein
MIVHACNLNHEGGRRGSPSEAGHRPKQKNFNFRGYQGTKYPDIKIATH